MFIVNSKSGNTTFPRAEWKHDNYTAMQSYNSVSEYFTSKQILPLGF